MVVRLLKRPIFAASVLTLAAMFASPISARTHDYPMQVQVIRTRWHGRHGWFSGFGHANLISQQAGHPPKQGMDFGFECTHPVRHTFAPDLYPARYGKNSYQVIVLLPDLGTDKGSECTLKIEMMDFIYKGGPNGALYSVPLTGGPPSPIQQGADGDQ